MLSIKLSIKNIGRKAIKFVIKPKGWLLIVPGIMVSIPYGYYKYRQFEMYNRIDKVLLRGTKNEVIKPPYCVEREKELEDIKSWVISNDFVKSFGVILGPSGTGKTFLTKEVACKGTPGLVYTHIGNPLVLSKTLAKSLDLDFRPPNFLDHMFEHFMSSASATYFKWPADSAQPQGEKANLEFVLKLLEESADRCCKSVKWKKRLNCRPTLFLDGVDEIAKADPNLFIFLVDQVKKITNDHSIGIVLVSSEGHVIPLIQSTSSKTRCNRIKEVLDINEDQTFAYLKEWGVSGELAERVHSLVGGRFVHLNFACENSRMGYDEIEKRLLNDVASNFMKMKPRHLFVLKKILNSKENVCSPDSMVPPPPSPDRPKEYNDFCEREEVVLIGVNDLVKLNLLRYNVHGQVAWHSQLVKYYIEKIWSKKYSGDIAFNNIPIPSKKERE